MKKYDSPNATVEELGCRDDILNGSNDNNTLENMLDPTGERALDFVTW